jgi:hypothetical protein
MMRLLFALAYNKKPPSDSTPPSACYIDLVISTLTDATYVLPKANAVCDPASLLTKRF